MKERRMTPAEKKLKVLDFLYDRKDVLYYPDTGKIVRVINYYKEEREEQEYHHEITNIGIDEDTFSVDLWCGNRQVLIPYDLFSAVNSRIKEIQREQAVLKEI